MTVSRFALSVLVAITSLGFLWSDRSPGAELEFAKGDRIAIIGNTLADRMQHHGWLETMIQSRFPEHELSFRNLGFAGDEITTRPRSANFGSPDQWLTKVEADVVFCFFGYNEALRGPDSLAGFETNLAGMLDSMLAQKYNGKSAPRIVVFSPIAHEDLESPHLPDGKENNTNLKLYTAAMAKVCEENDVTFVDLFARSQKLYEKSKQPLTMNGVHLLETGNRAIAEEIDIALFGKPPVVAESQLEKIREAVLDRNLHWFSRYRVVDGYNVYGGRSKLAWHGQSNADVMRREMEIFDVMTANRDKRVIAVAKGGDLQVKDDNIPKLLAVKTNRPGPLPGGKYSYLGGEEAIGKMKIHEGMQVNLFASEEMFPELINPVQMAVDTDSRLWASVWPSYPHWNPTQPRKDKLVILPDENQDGVADKCIVFADKLNSITGFEFWGGGVLVVAPPEVWFLKDTDGDDKADYKLRVLQGVSSADTHHTANALVIGPDGWLYWSRGVFHVTNMETPTKTFRSNRTGVYRFNPRTYEIEFHFPIGPNPHGDVFDRWGYQFANDGTSGTGNYVNIGKGIGNKQWFKKRVRPVPATGILSSSHFPEKFQNNFLICNAIGFLGVLQHEVKYDGADITAEEVDPILVSSDPNFRPTDLEIGGDGALYVSDWANALIGHMQHNIRDPNRDHDHGRIYRVTYKDRPLLKPAKMKGKPIAQVCENFFAQENSTRYRARLELSGRPTDEVVKEVGAFAAKLNPMNAPTDRDEGQALLECLWVFEEHRVPNMSLLKRVTQAEEPRVRAAAIRTLGHWAAYLGEASVKGWEEPLLSAARDESALVRAEAVKAAVEFPTSMTTAEVIFETAVRPLDPEMETVLKYARGQINVDQIVKDAVASGKPLSSAAQQYALRNASVNDLMQMKPTEPVYLAILARGNAKADQLGYAIKGLAELRKSSEMKLLLDLVAEEDAKEEPTIIASAGELLLAQSPEALADAKTKLQRLATQGKTDAARQLGYAAWMTADGDGENAFAAAAESSEGLRDMLEAARNLKNKDAQNSLFPLLQPLMFELPASIDAGGHSSGIGEPGLNVEYFRPNPSNVALASFDNLKPKSTGVAKDVSLDTDVISDREQFALRFTGSIIVRRGGKYNFYLSSDDGSRLYIDGQEVINHDGLHGMSEKSGSVELSAGSHAIVVTYYDNGGGDGLSLAWTGPGIKGKQKVPAESLSTGGGGTLHDVVIATVMAIPGHEAEKFASLAKLVKAGQSRQSAISGLRTIDKQYWAKKEVRPLVDSLVAHVSQLPASLRTSDAATDAVELTKALATMLPQPQAKAVNERLQNLDVRVIAISTVPYRMIYDKSQIAVEAGKPIEFRFSNIDHMPHNLTVALPGTMEEVGLLAEATAQDADAMARQYVPKTDKILVASNLLQPGDSQAITFEVPKEPGVYPIICTYPGHWRRMYAALYVAESLDDYAADPKAFFAKHDALVKDELLALIGKERDWKLEDLLDSVKPLEGPRSFDVGHNAFTVSSCIACHKLGGEGQQIGPELTKLETAKRNPEHILRSLINPSEKIDEKFQQYQFFLDDGRSVTGMILNETPDAYTVVDNPLAKKKPFVIRKADLDRELDKDEQVVPSKNSIMPKGLLGKLTREEILDLIAYIHSGGDKKHKLFGDHDHGEHGHEH